MPEDFETITVEHPADRLMLVTLNRPRQANAFNTRMAEELIALWQAIAADPDKVRVVVLTGAGERAFCAGADLKERQGMSQQAWHRQHEKFEAMAHAIMTSPRPVIAALNGLTIGGGFEIALACDMSICDNTALFGEPELRFGSSIVALLLPWYVNPKRAKKMLLSGQDRMDADEALRHGIVNEVVAEGEALRSSLALAREVALMDPDSVRMTKQAINQTYEIMGLGEALKMGADTSVRVETLETDLRKQFNRILRADGMKAALAWREARLDKNA